MFKPGDYVIVKDKMTSFPYDEPYLIESVDKTRAKMRAFCVGLNGQKISWAFERLEFSDVKGPDESELWD